MPQSTLNFLNSACVVLLSRVGGSAVAGAVGLAVTVGEFNLL